MEAALMNETYFALKSNSISKNYTHVSCLLAIKSEPSIFTDVTITRILKFFIASKTPIVCYCKFHMNIEED